MFFIRKKEFLVFSQTWNTAGVVTDTQSEWPKSATKKSSVYIQLPQNMRFKIIKGCLSILSKVKRKGDFSGSHIVPGADATDTKLGWFGCSHRPDPQILGPALRVLQVCDVVLRSCGRHPADLSCPVPPSLVRDLTWVLTPPSWILAPWVPLTPTTQSHRHQGHGAGTAAISWWLKLSLGWWQWREVGKRGKLWVTSAVDP